MLLRKICYKTISLFSLEEKEKILIVYLINADCALSYTALQFVKCPIFKVKGLARLICNIMKNSIGAEYFFSLCFVVQIKYLFHSFYPFTVYDKMY